MSKILVLKAIRGRVVMALLVAGLALATIALSALPANACDVQIGRTYKNGNNIVGYGSLGSDCSTSALATLEIQRWTGFQWDAGPTATAHQGYDTYLTRNCYGSGTQTWRTTITGRLQNGRYAFKESNHIRVNCGG